ncbi:uncharacterized protein LOC126747717 [Anthonomus grandis grandis]|uniref:uncharacterized protein LOC126747717 n=1 Tax=Anthonomus grandis grandis TaxID=2921223 RepID=UPI0021661DE2|nr:uncharacterized protein LOC126747717 [Anthonomus grandis grandis]
MPRVVHGFVTFFGFLTLVFMVQNSIRSLGDVDLLADGKLAEKRLRYQRALKQSVRDYGESDVDIEARVMEYTMVKKCCGKSESLNAQLECSMKHVESDEFFPRSMVVGAHFQPVEFMENVTYANNDECSDQVIFLHKDQVEYVLEQFSGNLLKIHNATMLYNFSQNYCLDRIAHESRFVLKLCPCKTTHCLPKCCPQGEYFHPKTEKCLKGNSSMLINGSLTTYKPLNCSRADSYCLDYFLNENHTLEVQGLFCNHSSGTRRALNEIINKCCPEGLSFNELFECVPRKAEPVKLGGVKLVYNSGFVGPPNMPCVMVTNKNASLFVSKGNLTSLSMWRIKEKYPKDLFCLDRINGSESEYAMKFTPPLTLQKCCPPRHFYNISAHACQFDVTEVAVPVVLKDGATTTLAEYFWTYNASCRRSQYIFANAYGTDKVFLHEHGSILKRKKMRRRLVPPIEYCLDVFRIEGLTVSNGFFCKNHDTRGRAGKGEGGMGYGLGLAHKNHPVKGYILLVWCCLIKRVA